MPAQAIAAVFGAQTSPFAAALISAVCSTHFVIAHAFSHAAGASAPAPVASAVRRSCHWWDLAQLGELGHAAGAAAPAPGALAPRRSPLWDLAQPGELGPPLPNWDGGRRTLVALLALLKRMALGKCSPRARSRFPHRNPDRSPDPEGSRLEHCNVKTCIFSEPRSTRNTVPRAAAHKLCILQTGRTAARRRLQHGELSFR
jgi:hypothetical protein